MPHFFENCKNDERRKRKHSVIKKQKSDKNEILIVKEKTKKVTKINRD